VYGLGEDLLLLGLGADGRLRHHTKLPYGLAASELIRLTTLGQVQIASEHVIVVDARPTGDAQLDAALVTLYVRTRPADYGRWLRAPRRGIREDYLRRLTQARVLRRSGRALFGTARVEILDPARPLAARERLDAIVATGGALDAGSAAFGGLAHAVGLPDLLYPGEDGRAARRRLREIAEEPAAEHIEDPDPLGLGVADTGPGLDAQTAGAIEAAVRAGVQLIVQATAAAAAHMVPGSRAGGQLP